MKDKKVVFIGTPDFAVPVLEKLIENTNVVLVVTQPDKKQGRGLTVSETPIKKVALKHNIEVFEPIKIKEDYDKIINANPDIIITCAYGQIIPESLLNFPPFKCVNVHASLLPKLRGGAPLHKSIIYGLSETGVTIMHMSPKMDAGCILSSKSIPILDTDNVGTIHDKLSVLGASLLIETLPHIFDGTIKPIPQDESEVTYAYNVTKEEELIDFNKTSREVFNQIRGLYPYPIGYATLNGNIIKILESHTGDKQTGKIGEIINVSKEGIEVKCADKSVVITKVKPSGKKEMSAFDFINGYHSNLKGCVFNE